MFAFALWDCRAPTLTLARDRLGLKPLFWGLFGALFLLTSEIKGLRAHRGWKPEIERESLCAYMRWGHVPAPYCIYRGLHKLPPGEFLVLRSGGEPKISSYWDPAQVVAAAQSNRLEIGETEALSKDSIRCRAMPSPVAWSQTCPWERSFRAGSIRR
jgi:asparagine synthase (glutamine-hydrolysing)